MPRSASTLRRAAALVVAGLAALGSAPARAAYEPVRSWEVDAPQALAVDARGNVFVASAPGGQDNHGVLRYTTSGRLTARWGSTGREPGQLDHPWGIAVNAAGSVYVVDITDRLSVFDSSGGLLAAAPLGGPGGAALSGFDVDVDTKGDLYVAHNGSDSAPLGVARFNAAGQGIAAWGAPGGGDGQFSNPTGVASDGRGNVYVVDAANHRVQRFTDTGAFVRGWGQQGFGPTDVHSPRAVAVDAAGDVYVADEGNRRVQHYRPDGTLAESIALPKNGPYRNQPWDLDFDEQGNLYVLDRETIASGYVNVLRPVAVSVRSSSLRHRTGRVAVKVSCTAAATCRGTLRLRKGKTTLGGKRYRIAAGKRATVRVKLTPSGRRVVRRARKHRVTVQLRPSNGSPIARKLTLRR